MNNRKTRKLCELCSKLAIETPERRQLLFSGVFIVNCEHISHNFHLEQVKNSVLVLSLLLTLNKYFPTVRAQLALWVKFCRN